MFVTVNAGIIRKKNEDVLLIGPYFDYWFFIIWADRHLVGI